MPEPIGRCPRGAPASGSRWGCGRLLPQGTRQPRPGLTRPSPEPGSLSVAGGFLYFNRCLQSLLGPRQGLPVFPGSTSPAAPGGVSLTVLSFLPTDDPAGSLAADGLVSDSAGARSWVTYLPGSCPHVPWSYPRVSWPGLRLNSPSVKNVISKRPVFQDCLRGRRLPEAFAIPATPPHPPSRL